MAYLRAAILWPIARPETTPKIRLFNATLHVSIGYMDAKPLTESMIVGECGADRLAG
ncbi:hypothetical protein PPTG_23086 [Phytophthora nicotianae INRA-310]|uniref:Uncharacterized protein n=1 Tax=Phytophthora nicotianae (strain INRA-310) TaxID=761204 RepID=W2Q3U5_PHYN3|nr:hypothetical protein PPTG_23086 [Phytophthora nicotianae INRA-310]ETN07853.1 hypothetical protein PPTG_23086 [Phytophthora nicotianae INRA-310]